jgi:hypothetical protein
VHQATAFAPSLVSTPEFGLIKKERKPVAAPMDDRLLERIRRLQARFDELGTRLAKGFAEVPEAEGMAAIEVAAANVRREMKAEARPGPLTRQG